MATSLDVHIATFQLSDTASDWQGDAKVAHVLRAPTQAKGGGITILEAWASNQAATGAGTGFALQLENWGTSGTAIKSGAAGTVAAGIAGTADPWAAGVPKNFTLSYPFLAAGEYLVLRKNETSSSDPTRGQVVIHYAMGE